MKPLLREWLSECPLPAWPRVTAILAVRNEEAHIGAALESVCAQDWPHDRLEILVADGRSSDATRAIVAAVSAHDPRVRLIDNPERYVAHGLNRALAQAGGRVIVRVDGHCRVPPAYVRDSVALLRRGEAECAGGPVRARGETRMARAIALAMSTPWGVGGATFRTAVRRAEVDHLPFGVWRREVFELLGGFDETLVRNQDDELSDRLRRAGGRIVMLPELAAEYWSRATPAGLWRQYRGYGFWKVRVIRKRGGWPSSPRHLVPAAFVTGMAASAALAVTPLAPLALVLPGAYAAFLAVAALHTGLSRIAPEAALLPVVLPVMHAAYGVGFLHALALALLGREPRAAAAPAPIRPVDDDATVPARPRDDAPRAPERSKAA